MPTLTPHPPPATFPLVPQIKTYHCLCSTLLLATPYALPTLPRRAPPALDKAYILPLPSLENLSTTQQQQQRRRSGDGDDDDDDADVGKDIESGGGGGEGSGKGEVARSSGVLPSLLTQAMRAGRKGVVVRREDGFERRRVWRCGRCGVGVGYEILGEGEGEGEGEERVIYLLEGGLVETGEMGGG